MYAIRSYYGIHNREYRLALLRFIREEAADLLEMNQLQDTLTDLENRLLDPDRNAVCGRLVQSITGGKMSNRAPFKMTAQEFNEAAEKNYRHRLRLSHLQESWEYFSNDIRAMLRNNFV